MKRNAAVNNKTYKEMLLQLYLINHTVGGVFCFSYSLGVKEKIYLYTKHGKVPTSQFRGHFANFRESADIYHI